MGKSLRGKECGKGICQRKDGLYSARFVSSEGKCQVKCFSSLPEARNWLEDAKYADRHEDVFAPPDMTVTEWFEFWISHIVRLSAEHKENLPGAVRVQCKARDW